MAESNELEFRPAQPDDMKFVLSSWLNSWRTCPWAGTIRNDQYRSVMMSTIEGLVMRGAEFLVATHKASGRILGWVCYETLTRGEACIHYVYTKDFALKLGINEQLLERIPGSKPGFYTHRYRQVVDACQGYKHVPEIARRK